MIVITFTFEKQGEDMIGVEIERIPLNIDSCSELKDHESFLSYVSRDCSPHKRGARIIFEEISLRKPAPLIKEHDIGIMLAFVKDIPVKIIGLHNQLLTLFVVGNKYQRGTAHCLYCKRGPNIDEKCQLRCFFEAIKEMGVKYAIK